MPMNSKSNVFIQYLSRFIRVYMFIMYVNLCFFISAVVYIATASQLRTTEDEGKSKRIPAVDTLISKLEEEQWQPDEGSCLQATLDMLRGVKNNTLWAVWAWDSMQAPVGSMYGAASYPGNYDQCLQAPWSSDARHPGLRSQYCLVQVKSLGVEQTRSFDPFDDAEDYYQTPTIDGRVFNQHSLGVCLPSICSPSSVGKLAQHLLQITHLPGKVMVDLRDCETAGEEIQYPAGYYMFCLSQTKVTAIDIITKSFCIKKNYTSLFSVNSDEIKSMHGVRSMTAALVVGIHCFYISFFLPVVNGLELNETLRSGFGRLLLHTVVIVDTFFAMSGLLLIRSLLLGKLKNAIKTLLKRYFRLIGPHAICVLYITTTAMYMDRGPLWRSINKQETEVCKEHWWRSLLMINTHTETLCHVVSWYVSCDFQLAILAATLFYIYKRSKKLGFAVFLAVAMAATIHLGFNVFWRRLDILPFNYRVATMKRKATDLNYIYLQSHARAGSYMIGMAMGYIMSAYKPAEYRNVISKKWSIAIAILSLLLMTAILSTGVVFADKPYPLTAAVIVATNRIFWAIAVCSLIGVCEYGKLPIVPGLLSLSGFVPLSKLSYCLYLLHPLVLSLYKINTRGPIHFRMFNVIIDSCGVLVVSGVASLALHLMLEAPLVNISNEIFNDKSRLLERYNNKKDNNQNGKVVILQNEATLIDKMK